MEHSLKNTATAPRGYGRLFFIILAVALSWQIIGFLQMQISAYHRTLAEQFKVILTVNEPLADEDLAAVGQRIGTQTEVKQVKLFSAQEGLKALQNKNPRLAQALVALGREPMPAYLEVRLAPAALHDVSALTEKWTAQYPQVSAKYSAEQAQMAFYSGLCVRTLNIAAALALAVWVIFMFLVEAYPAEGQNRGWGGILAGVLAALCAFALMALLIYPTGLLAENLQRFTTWERQIILLVLCGLLGRSLEKWRKF